MGVMLLTALLGAYDDRLSLVGSQGAECARGQSWPPSGR